MVRWSTSSRTPRDGPPAPALPRHRYLIMRAALLHTYGGTVELGEHPDRPDRTGRAGSARRPSSRSTCCAPAVRRTSAGNRCRTSLACRASGSSGLARLSASERVWFATSAGMGPVRRESGRAVHGRRGPWCRSPRRSPTPRRGASAPPRSPPGCRSPGGPDCSPANGSSCSARAGRSARWRSPSRVTWTRPAWSLSVARRLGDARGRAAGATEVVPLWTRTSSTGPDSRPGCRGGRRTGGRGDRPGVRDPPRRPRWPWTMAVAGQHRRWRPRRRRVLLRRAPQPAPSASLRLHQQRDHAGAAGRGPDPGARARRGASPSSTG